MAVSEPSVLALDIANGAMEYLLADLIAKGPIKLRVYSANQVTMPASPVYGNAQWVNDTLMAEVTVPSPTIVDGNLIFAAIPDMLNTGTAINADIIEIRSTTSDLLYFRVLGDHRHINHNDIFRIEKLTVNARTGLLVVDYVDPFPNSPFPIEFRVEFPQWANAPSYYTMKNASLTMNFGRYPGQETIEFPSTKLCWELGRFDQSGKLGTGDFMTIDGEFTNSNLNYNFTLGSTVPNYGSSATSVSSWNGGYWTDFTTNTYHNVDPNFQVPYTFFTGTLSVDATLGYDPFETTGWPSYLNDKPRVFRKKHGETSFTEITLYNADDYYYSVFGIIIPPFTNLDRASVYNRARSWKFDILL